MGNGMANGKLFEMDVPVDAAHAKSVGTDYLAAVNYRDHIEDLPDYRLNAIKAIEKHGEWLLIVTVVRDEDGSEMVAFRGFDGLEELPRALRKVVIGGKWKMNKPYTPVDK